MGFKYSYSDQEISQITRTVGSIYRDVTNPRIDGYNQWAAKQDLYQLKWLIDEAIKRCPEFGPEKEWLRDQEKKKVIRILKNEM